MYMGHVSVSGLDALLSSMMNYNRVRTNYNETRPIPDRPHARGVRAAIRPKYHKRATKSGVICMKCIGPTTVYGTKSTYIAVKTTATSGPDALVRTPDSWTSGFVVKI